jgi:DNA-3-methyladenine glycosylase II
MQRDTGVEVALEGPLDVAGSLEGFRRWGDDLIVRWDGAVLLRTLRNGGESVAWAVSPRGGITAPRLRVSVDDPAHLEAAAAAARGLFVTGSAALAALAAHDPAVAVREARHPGIRPALEPDLLTALVRAISAQQVNLRWAATTRARLARATGIVRSVGGREVWALDAARLAETPPAVLRELQLTTRKAEYIVGVAAEVASGRLDLEVLSALPDDEVVARLVAVRGVGHWTAEWVLARTLGRPRVVAGDLGVRKAVGAAYLEGRMPTEAEVRRLTAHWGPAATVAQAVLLQSLLLTRPAPGAARRSPGPHRRAGPPPPRPSP